MRHLTKLIGVVVFFSKQYAQGTNKLPSYNSSQRDKSNCSRLEPPNSIPLWSYGNAKIQAKTGE